MEEPQSVSITQATATAKSGRPRLMLSEEQAARLQAYTADLIIKHAHNMDRHTGFVLDFLRAVYQVTGQMFSAGIYRKLLRAYVAERRPSTATIEAQKETLQKEIVKHCAQFPLKPEFSSLLVCVRY
jgi:hypothetical protein